MNAAYVVLWGLLVSGLTALAVSLAWYAALHRERVQHEATLTELVVERTRRHLEGRGSL